MSETARLARPEMPISSSITTRSLGDSMISAISPVVIIAVITQTAATSAIWRPTDRLASRRTATAPTMATTTTAPITEATTCSRSPLETPLSRLAAGRNPTAAVRPGGVPASAVLASAVLANAVALDSVMRAPARSGSRRPRR